MVLAHETKTGEGREVPLLPELVDVLEALPRRMEWVFTHETWSRKKGARGKIISKLPDYGKGGRRRYPWDLEGMHVIPHTFRHTFTTWKIRAGVPLPVIQQWMGHSSIDVTVRIYGHVQAEDCIQEMLKGPRLGLKGAPLRVIEGGQETSPTPDEARPLLRTSNKIKEAAG